MCIALVPDPGRGPLGRLSSGSQGAFVIDLRVFKLASHSVSGLGFAEAGELLVDCVVVAPHHIAQGSRVPPDFPRPLRR